MSFRDPASNAPSNTKLLMTLIGQWWRQRLAHLLSLSVRARFWLLLVAHAAIFAASFVAAYVIRFDSSGIPAPFYNQMLGAVGWVMVIKLFCFYVFRSFHGWWRHVTFSDFKALGQATVASLLVMTLFDYFVMTDDQIPRGIVIMDAMISFAALASIRSSWRLLNEEVKPRLSKQPRTNVILVGASEATWKLAHQLRSLPDLRYNIIGLISTPGCDTHRWAASLPVLGDLDSLELVLSCYSVQEILVPAGEVSGADMRKLAELAKENSKRLRVIPSIQDVLASSGKMHLRDVDINDLLRRESVVLDNSSIASIVAGRVVLVTGAGGSIGSEICRQVLKFEPDKLILLGRGENRIFEIENELKAHGSTTQIVPVIVDVTDRLSLERCFETHRPNIIFHAAAHKHVPLMEANIPEAVKNNIQGTKNVADCAVEFGASEFVLISTDKAVNPTSVMGATKHLAERYVLSRNEPEGTRFVVVRFGNVLGSNGSVVPIFQRQIREGGPITITDPRMKRYFMSIPEASQLVLQAAAQGKGGEIFVLDMGQPVLILDLARDLIRLSGLPEDSVDIQFSGIRPGEKLYEELYFDEEHSLATAHPKIFAAYHRQFPVDEVSECIQDFVDSIYTQADSQRFIAMFQEAIPEFRHSAPHGVRGESAKPQPAPVVAQGQ
ncbi:MAG: polysaccharide biosynthesis protein [Pirellulaceae bacterium]|nr:polysaccharide biosynthesis protein [Pirellulaceae bacterium]